jgi:DNA mismatch endonuclease (patch repair protein)
MDRVTSEKRSEIMRSVKGKNTEPELFVRKIVHALGYRYRLHVATLPGTTDIVFPKLKKIILINGCFWHVHPGCKKAAIPKSRSEYWAEKLLRNVERDKETSAALTALGWQQMVIWQCELKNKESVTKKIISFLGERTREK